MARLTRSSTSCSCQNIAWFSLLLFIVAFQGAQIVRLESQIAALTEFQRAAASGQPSLGDWLGQSEARNADSKSGLLLPGEGGTTAAQLPESFSWTGSPGCQAWPRQHHDTPKGLVVTLILTPDGEPAVTALQTIACRSMPSQLSHFLGPQQLDMLILLGANNQLRGAVSFDFLSQCLNLVKTQDGSTRHWQNLDGSKLTTTEYRWDNRVSVFLAQVDVQYPQYVQRDKSILDRTIEPSYCNDPKSYIQGTRWYSNELLHLAILQEYHWFIKLDLDVFFVKTIEWSLLHDLQTRNSIFAHTAEYPPINGAECAGNIVQAMKDFLKASSHSLSFCDDGNPLLKIDRDHYYSNFIIGRVDFWTQPIIRELGRYLSEYPKGFFTYRWTDQIFWAQAMGLLVPLNQDAVTDYTELRCSPEANCWIAQHDSQLYGRIETTLKCGNDAYFAHTKNYEYDWNRMVTHTEKLWRSDTEVHTLTYKDECKERLDRKRKERAMKDDQCRSWPSRQHHERPRGLVTTLLLTPDDEPMKQHLRKIACRALPSQMAHLIGPQQWDMLIIIGGDRSHEKMDLDVIIDCLALREVEHDAKKVWQNLDGTALSTTEYRWENRVSIFLAEIQLDWPDYIQKDMSILEKPIAPANCNAPRSYIQRSRWYTNEMLNLAILQNYHWFIKLDPDVFFVKTVEWSLLHDLQTRNTLFAHTAEYPAEMGAACTGNIVKAVQDFLHQSEGRKYCDDSNPKLKIDRDHYYSNFIIGRVDFWTQPSIREFGRYLSEYPEGYFHYRWTDQIFWAQALGLMVKVDDKTVTDYTELRCSVEHNCWVAVFYYYLYGQGTHDACDNGAYFLHTRNADLDWNPTISHPGELWQSDTEVHPLGYKDECPQRLSDKQNKVNAARSAQQQT